MGRFEDLTAAITNNSFVVDTNPFTLVEIYGLSSRQCCQHLQGSFLISRRRQQVSLKYTWIFTTWN